MFWNRKKKQEQKTTQITWRTPEGVVYSLLGLEITEAPHTLIAGTTGSGKTTFMRSALQALLAEHSPASAKLVLIDPKQTELYSLRQLPHVIRYADTAPSALDTLRECEGMMMQRFAYMREQGQTVFCGYDLYIIIDELADLMLSAQAREIKNSMQKILQLGRAAKVHIIAGTQCPNRKTIPAELVCNFTNRLGLRCLSAIESRQIIGVKGCETLPEHGEGIYIHGCHIDHYRLPYVTADDLQPLLHYWNSPECRVA